MPRRARFYDILDRRPRPTSTALRKLVITVFERLQALTEKPNPHSRSLWLSDSVRLAIMGAAEAKACALRSTAAKRTVCPCLGDSDWTDAWSRSLKSSISGSAPITAIVRSRAATALYILRLDENQSEWPLAMYASPKARTLGAITPFKRIIG